MVADDAVIGVIFPMIPEHVLRFFEQHKTVFVKFVSRGMHTRVREGSKLFFYESRSRKQIVGEATISRVSSGTMSEVLLEYNNGLFLNLSELREYVGNRTEKKMLILVLYHVRKYAAPLSVDVPITMAGRYMTKEFSRRLEQSRA